MIPFELEVNDIFFADQAIYQVKEVKDGGVLARFISSEDKQTRIVAEVLTSRAFTYSWLRHNEWKHYKKEDHPEYYL